MYDCTNVLKESKIYGRTNVLKEKIYIMLTLEGNANIRSRKESKIYGYTNILKESKIYSFIIWQGSLEVNPSILIGSFLVGILPYGPFLWKL